MPRYNISDAVSEILDEMQSIHIALRNDLINFSALARFIKPKVKEFVGNKDVSDDAIIMAARRYAKSYLDDRQARNLMDAVCTCNILTREGMVNVNYTRSEETVRKLAELQNKKVKWDIGEKMYVIERSEEISVIASKRFLNELLKIAPKKEIIETIEDLTLFSVKYAHKVLETPGVFTFFLDQFGSANVNILGVFSTHSIISFVIKEREAARIYERLNKAISECKKETKDYGYGRAEKK